jgi:hypothetical protein
MDKFALMQLRKKQERLALQKAMGMEEGDVLAHVKQEITEAELDAMHNAFGYLNAPTACFAISKPGSAALWWKWDNPHPPWTPLNLRDSDDEDEETKEIDGAAGTSSSAITGMFGGWFGSSKKNDDDEDMMEEVEFDENGEVIEKELTPAQQKAKDKAMREAAERKAEKARLAELYKVCRRSFVESSYDV